jgi:hypothetical protein
MYPQKATAQESDVGLTSGGDVQQWQTHPDNTSLDMLSGIRWTPKTGRSSRADETLQLEVAIR